MLYTLDQSYDTTPTGEQWPLRGLSGYDILAQTFTPGQTGYLSRASVKLAKLNSPTGLVWLEIHPMSGADVSSTVLATSATKDVSTIATTQTMYDFDFDTPTIQTASTKLALVLNGNYTKSDTNIVYWNVSAAKGYAGGDYFKGNTYAPTIDNTYEGNFRTYYDPNISSFVPKIFMIQ